MPSTALAPTYDFDKAIVALRADGSSDLGALLAELATVPSPAVQKISAMPVADRMGEGLMRAVAQLPSVFGLVKPPKTRRALTRTELVKVKEEKKTIDAVLKALTERKTELHEMISTSFDVVAEKRKLVDSSTPRDAKGHYLMATPGKPETQPVDGGGEYFTRERTSDTTTFSHALLQQLYDQGEISRRDYLACTVPVTGRRLSEKKLRKMLLSKAQRERGQRLIKLIGTVKRGTNSIHLRGK